MPRHVWNHLEPPFGCVRCVVTVRKGEHPPTCLPDALADLEAVVAYNAKLKVVKATLPKRQVWQPSIGIVRPESKVGVADGEQA